jgi:signal transduction histidine kinase
MLLFLVPSLAQVLLDPFVDPSIGVVYALVSVLPLAWRRTHPVLAAVVGATPWWLPTEGFLYLGYVVAVILFFSLGTWARDLRWTLLAGTWGLAAGTTGTLLGPEDDVAVFGTWLALLGGFAAGRLVRHERSRSEKLKELTERLEEERGHAERSAVAEERARLARELHDVVGHEVTLIAIQSEAAASALRVDPTRATAPIEAIRQTAHRASAEMRAILGMLDLDGGEPVPAPDMFGVEGIARRASTLGIDNSLEVEGSPWPDSPNVYLALNRVVQEALTNAGRHAPGTAVDIAIVWRSDDVSIRVTNQVTGAVSVPGYGTRGMTERARLLGGTFSAGARPDGNYVVTMRLPSAQQDQP